MWALILYWALNWPYSGLIEQDRILLALSGLSEDQCKEIAYSAAQVVPEGYVVICVEEGGSEDDERSDANPSSSSNSNGSGI